MRDSYMYMKGFWLPSKDSVAAWIILLRDNGECPPVSGLRCCPELCRCPLTYPGLLFCLVTHSGHQHGDEDFQSHSPSQRVSSEVTPTQALIRARFSNIWVKASGTLDGVAGPPGYLRECPSRLSFGGLRPQGP